MEEKTLVINEDATVAYSPKTKAAFSLQKPPRQEPLIPFDNSLNLIAKYVPWGTDNNFPDNVIEEAYKSTIVPPVLEWKADALYSGGLVYGTIDNSIDGEEKLTAIKDPEIEAWLEDNNYKLKLLKMCQNYYWFYNVFPQLILSKDRKYIAAFDCLDSSFCRWEQQNPNNYNLIDNVFINANWKLAANGANTISIPVLDVWYDGVGKLLKRKDSDSYIYPVFRPTPGKSYYQVAAWDGLRESGWLAVAAAIPLFKKHLMKNQLSIKYHIQVAHDWWSWKYPSFYNETPLKRKEIQENELNNFNDLMTGELNAGRSIMTTFRTDLHTGKEYAGWKIEVIDDKIKDGVYVEDSQEASSHHYSALGVDPTLIGTAPGKAMGAGSGSDKRVAFNIYINKCKAAQDILLQPFNFIASYNGWKKKYPGLTFWFRNYWISTLDEGQQTKPQTQA